ncbi:MAG TPA: hypothetical protein VHT21_18265 [Stellaceae bacterium]|nr:hypothetical protein [Stellaceae bacterium]
MPLLGQGILSKFSSAGIDQREHSLVLVPGGLDGYGFDIWNAGKGVTRGYPYRRIEDAHYARKAEIKAQGRTVAAIVCQTLDEFIDRRLRCPTTLKEAEVETEQEVELQKHLERRLASLLEEFEHWLSSSAASTPWRRGTARSRWSMTSWPRRRGSSNRGENPQRTAARKGKRSAYAGSVLLHTLHPSNEILGKRGNHGSGSQIRDRASAKTAHRIGSLTARERLQLTRRSGNPRV